MIEKIPPPLPNMGPPGMGFGHGLNYGIIFEAVFSLVIVILSLFVYFKTKKLYELSGHKGIKFFRLTFLFFGIAYIFRLFSILLIIYKILPMYLFRHSLILGLVPYAIFSTTGALYLTFSTFTKNNKAHKTELFIYVMTGLIAFLTYITKSPLIFIISQTIFFASAAIISFVKRIHSKNKHHSNMYVVYFLLFLFWVINHLIFLNSRTMFLMRPLTYVLGFLIFLIISIKVLKITNLDKKKVNGKKKR